MQEALAAPVRVDLFRCEGLRRSLDEAAPSLALRDVDSLAGFHLDDA